MTLKEYEQAASRTCPSLNSLDIDMIHMILGIQTESAELADILKKNIAYGKPIDWINYEEEIGDLMWYIINLCRMTGFNLEDILDKNIAKLRQRYPDKFTTNLALNRNLDAEREILEG